MTLDKDDIMASSIFKWPASRKVQTRPKTSKIAVHCSATPEGRDVSAATIDGWHRAQGWAGIGYHYVVRLDGSIEEGRPRDSVGSGVSGHNSDTVHIVYIGGLADDAKTPKDTRTPEQKDALVQLIKHLKAVYRSQAPIVQGHRDFSPDRNGNGRIDPNEWLKACPSFDAKAEYAAI